MKKSKNLKPGSSTTNSMKKIKKDPLVQDAKNMLIQKTNEDHNQQKPDPKDPNETKNDPDAGNSSVGEGDKEAPPPEKTINQQNNAYPGWANKTSPAPYVKDVTYSKNCVTL